MNGVKLVFKEIQALFLGVMVKKIAKTALMNQIRVHLDNVATVSSSARTTTALHRPLSAMVRMIAVIIQMKTTATKSVQNWR